MASKVLKVAVGLLTGVSLCLPPEMAEAGPFGWGGHPGVYGGYRGGWVGHRPHPIYAGGGYYGGYGYGYPGAYGGYGYGYPAYYGGYGYPAYYGGYYPGYYGYYRRRSNSGAAVAAGLIAGVALGAILANASRSQRAYRRPAYYRR